MEDTFSGTPMPYWLETDGTWPGADINVQSNHISFQCSFAAASAQHFVLSDELAKALFFHFFFCVRHQLLHH